jgi:hypothetical protein
LKIEPTDIINTLQLANDYVSYLDDWDKERFLKYYYPTFRKFLEMVIENNAILYICNPSICNTTNEKEENKANDDLPDVELRLTFAPHIKIF